LRAGFVTSTRVGSPHSAMKKIALLVALLALSNCKTLTGSGEEEPSYASDAAKNMKLGEQALAGKNYEQAEKYFEHVRSKYPFLEVSKEAELRLADEAFDRDLYSLARDRYQAFAKLHPTHPKAEYAAYRALLTHVKEIPSDYFFMPPSFEKDQVSVVASLKGANEFIRQYPQSTYVPEVKKIVEDMRRRLAAHEFYVAAFYAKRHQWKAVVLRLNVVERDFPGLGLDEKALFGLYDAYTHLNQKAEAKATLQQVIGRLPGTAAARKAQKLLGS
jgi:outer membrane protein assembly factor BamD